MDNPARKSVVVGLPVVPYNQNKRADVIKYLEWLQDFFKGIAKDSHEDDNENQNLNEDEHLIQIPNGGDLLGRERITGAKMLRKGCNQASERFDNMSEVAEFWHAKQAFLSVSLNYMEQCILFLHQALSEEIKPFYCLFSHSFLFVKERFLTFVNRDK